MSRTNIENVLRALEAINDGLGTDADRRILKTVGGTKIQRGRFELALSMKEVGRRLKRAPGIIEDRVESGVAVNKAEFNGHTLKDEDDRPTRETPPRFFGVLSIGRKGKVKPKRTE